MRVVAKFYAAKSHDFVGRTVSRKRAIVAAVREKINTHCLSSPAFTPHTHVRTVARKQSIGDTALGERVCVLVSAALPPHKHTRRCFSSIYSLCSDSGSPRSRCYLIYSCIVMKCAAKYYIINTSALLVLLSPFSAYEKRSNSCIRAPIHSTHLPICQLGHTHTHAHTNTPNLFVFLSFDGVARRSLSSRKKHKFVRHESPTCGIAYTRPPDNLSVQS